MRCILRCLFSRFKHFSFFSVTSFVLAGMIYTMPQIKPFNWCITVGVGVHSCRLQKYDISQKADVDLHVGSFKTE